MSGKLVVALIALGVGLVALIAIALAVFTEDPRLPQPTPTAVSSLPSYSPVVSGAGS